MADVNTPTGPSLGERVTALLHRDPGDSAHPLRADAALAAGAGLLGAAIAYADTALRPDALGWALLAAAALALAGRRRHPMAVLAVIVACIAPYQLLNNAHMGPMPIAMTALYTVAVTGTVRRTVTAGACVVGFAVTGMSFNGVHRVFDVLRTSGWLVAALVFGVALRNSRAYVAEQRAVAARETERQLTEERLRIARDLHDLLAHSITLIGVRTSVAAHVLTASPERLDRAAVAAALDSIADTCREARAELRTTLTVLRADEHGPLPDLDGLPDLARSAKAELTVEADGVHVPPAVGAAAYRIVQESLTNAVRHAGPDATARVRVEAAGEVLRVTVTDDGRGGAAEGSGFGIVGMRERARSVGGTLEAGPREGGGFRVTADLPLVARPLRDRPLEATA
ncbi:two-component sensor histidine kinase [Streptomyces violascens]|uniref:histidine kinase n=1 Tax=Streptomyces violascens TaxID=67381 RepID=A0ABQ3QKZ7_9ACTN|nr:two-component sensor histidine kinase [Streptomyces violascens]GHI37947.1 two-component sensor histidine kinase [Streptomyces violascens]